MTRVTFGFFYLITEVEVVLEDGVDEIFSTKRSQAPLIGVATSSCSQRMERENSSRY